MLKFQWILVGIPMKYLCNPLKIQLKFPMENSMKHLWGLIGNLVGNNNGYPSEIHKKNSIEISIKTIDFFVEKTVEISMKYPWKSVENSV